MTRGLIAVLGLQILVVCGVTFAFLLSSGLLAAKSAVIGGMIAVIPGAYYAWRLIGSRNISPDRLLRVHVGGESGKLALTFVLFGLTFAFLKDISAIPLFATYISALLMYWMALIVFRRV